MMQQLDAYQKLLQRLVDLEQQLMCAFEAQVKIHPPPREFLELYRPKLDHIDWAKSTISHIIRLWPQDVHFAIVLLLSKQMKGIIVLNGQHWLFETHGSDEVSFTHLSPTLDVHIFEQLKQGKTDVLDGVRYYGGGGCVDGKYLHEGRFDGVRAWSASVFAGSIDCPFRHLSESEHQALLEALVDKGVLVDWSPIYGFPHRNFIFAAAKEEAEPAEK